jgi:hypothetical protein
MTGTGNTSLITEPTNLTSEKIGTTGMNQEKVGLKPDTLNVPTGSTYVDPNLNTNYDTTFTTPATTGLMTGTTEVPLTKTTFQSNIIPNIT